MKLTVEINTEQLARATKTKRVEIEKELPGFVADAFKRLPCNVTVSVPEACCEGKAVVD
jgi:hypothetical protein